jgi:NDP-sugar pyrophosphorylase family protein
MQSLSTLSAAILCGGLGTRLRPVVADRPKPLALVRGRPFLTYLLDRLDAAGVREVVLLTGHRAGQVRAALGDRYAGLRLRYSEEPAPLGTAGAVRLALPLLRGPAVLLLNGDSYCRVHLAAFHAAHRRRAADVSLVLAQSPDAARFGRVETGRDGRVRCFREKAAAAGAAWINAGVYLIDRGLLEALPAGEPRSLERDLFPEWVGSTRFFGFRCRGRFLDIGTPESYAAAERFFRPAEAALTAAPAPG